MNSCIVNAITIGFIAVISIIMKPAYNNNDDSRQGEDTQIKGHVSRRHVLFCGGIGIADCSPMRLVLLAGPREGGG